MNSTSDENKPWYTPLENHTAWIEHKDCFKYVETLDEALKLTLTNLITMGVNSQSAPVLYNTIQQLNTAKRPVSIICGSNNNVGKNSVMNIDANVCDGVMYCT